MAAFFLFVCRIDGPPLSVVLRHQGQVGAALVLGGVDETGKHLFTVAPHGSTDKLPYVTMGSGSLAAMAVFESQWQKDLDVSLFCFCFGSSFWHLTLNTFLPLLSLSLSLPEKIRNRSCKRCHFGRYL